MPSTLALFETADKLHTPAAAAALTSTALHQQLFLSLVLPHPTTTWFVKRGSDYYTSRGKWDDGKDDYNQPEHHIKEHEGPCIASRLVTATGPANKECITPPSNVTGPCTVPAFCPDPPAPGQVCPTYLCPPGNYLRYDVSKAVCDTHWPLNH